MTTSSPAEASTELLNSLFAIEFPGPSEKLNGLLWKARGLARKLPGDFDVRLALATAKALTGDRIGAQEDAEAAFGLRHFGDIPSYVVLAHVLAGLDDDRAGTLLKELASEKGSLHDEAVVGNSVRYAFLFGDTDFLHRIAEEGLDREFNARECLDVLELAGLKDLFAGHQKIVRDIVGGYQVWVNVRTEYDGETEPILVTNRYVVADKALCRRLERRVFDALAEYYLAAERDPGCYIPYLQDILISVEQGNVVAAA
ncbi:MAG: hypothetical protein CMM08_16020 [Rhodospirillaceae bacterium]|jgi:hypothetical protein|nr:hypothetical protein [Rhodospirillaceae bacterium]|tara:strand:+ start:741 stop:1511 length:771 start_codon:yes stop_codon:yes gene_type:complete